MSQDKIEELPETKKKIEKKTSSPKEKKNSDTQRSNFTVKNAKQTNKDGDWMSHAVGKRKSSIAKIWIAKSKTSSSDAIDSIKINNKSFKDFFGSRDVYASKILQPFVTTNTNAKDLFIKITTCGGGLTGCIDAIKLGISRAVFKFCSEDAKSALKVSGLMTRDSRVVESKKYGLKKARKAERFSKR